ncbi:CBS domain-containing protein [Sedimenticola sp.]|uniref:CBS domain-containing protein n=1 Tax=Sedimenticola sp. TaxID=1940285 RepID=UPI003D0CB081
MTLNDVLQKKPGGVITIPATMDLLEAINTMCDHKVGALLVKAEDGSLQGIATERDILRFCSTSKGNLKGAVVNDAMTRKLIVVTPSTSVDEAMTLMTEHRFRHLPVLENNVPIGMISIGDLVKAQLTDITVEASYLREYISYS